VTDAVARTRSRIVTIDVLRGFALLGILIMNIQAFAMPVAAYFNPLVYGGFEGLDGTAWLVTRLLFDVKFLSIFSTIFGASLMLAGEGPQALRRLRWLIVFGLLHGPLLFFGDVLFTYGVVGLFVIRARSWPVARQAAIGLALVASGAVLHAALGAAYPLLPAWAQDELARALSGDETARHLEVFRGGWLAQLPLRAALSFENQVVGTLLESGVQSAGCMLLGMAAVRVGFFEGATDLHRHGLLAFVLGIATTGLGIAVGLGGSFAPRVWLLSQSIHLAGCLGVTFGWVVAIVALTRAPSASRITGPVARLGSVAFTAYILQSVAGLVVFGGQGLGLYGTLGRAELLVAPIAFWLLQVALAAAWTARFRYGPLEALWRTLYRGTSARRASPPT
jgi:uncharacterized protein